MRHVWNEREILSKFAEEEPPFPFANRLLGTFKDDTTVNAAVYLIQGGFGGGLLTLGNPNFRASVLSGMETDVCNQILSVDPVLKVFILQHSWRCTRFVHFYTAPKK